jgi:prepilin peptidase CpaA
VPHLAEQGDVKALMALGAWIGPGSVLGVAACALIVAGICGVALLVARGELYDFARRWMRTALSALAFRRLTYERPAPGSAAAGGLPFAAALAFGLAAHWSGGLPW